MIVDAIKAKTGVTVERHQVDMEPIRTLGEKKAHIRLTVDLMPEIKIIVHREGESVDDAHAVAAAPVAAAAPVVEATPVVETVAEAEAPAEA